MSASRGTVTPMENSRYMECLSSDYADLRDAARIGLGPRTAALAADAMA